MEQLSRWSWPALGGVAAVVAVLPGVLAFEAGGVIAAVVAGAIGALAGGSALAAKFRAEQIANSLPLELGGVGLKARRDGFDVAQFRARLGYGRAVRAVRSSLRVTRPGQEPAVLATEDLPITRIGPWTVLAVDRQRLLADDAELHLVVEADERGRTWRAERTYSVRELKAGRFAAPIEVAGGRVTWTDGWDRVIAAPPG